MPPVLQSLLLKLYAACRRGGLLDDGPGRRAFLAAYTAYKLHLEGRTLHALRPHVRPGSTAIDVGANIGVFALRFARWAGPAGRVVAIEPEARNADELERRAARAGTRAAAVTVVRGVAAERSGTLHLAVNDLHPGDHRLAAAGVPVAAHALDDLAAAHGLADIALVKIDVQGAEVRVLQGAAALLRRWHPALFVEVDDAALAGQGASVAALEALLRAAGYRAFRRAGGAWAPVESLERDGPARVRQGYADYLFLADGRGGGGQ